MANGNGNGKSAGAALVSSGRGLFSKVKNMEPEDFLRLGVGAFAYYYFARQALHPSTPGGEKPAAQAAFAGMKFWSAFIFHQALVSANLLYGFNALVATVGGVALTEWQLRKDRDRAALPPTVGWGHHGWSHHDWDRGWDQGDWDEHHRHHIHDWE